MGGGRTVLVVKVCPTEEEVISGLARVPPSAAVNKLWDLELPPHFIVTCLLSPSLGWAVRYLNVVAKPQSPDL